MRTYPRMASLRSPAPAGRKKWPATLTGLLRLLEHVRRHTLLQPGQADDDEPLELRDQLTPAQQRLLSLFGVDPQTYGN